ncbi:UDP-Glycosyltransferase/glycogen phosphorylase [Trametes elegans]|nr:UDP-Glycosyltransferase/glycogen phosphorylase [Trametes elegans]
MTITQVHKHIAVFTYPAWGHARPLINLVARLVKMKVVNVTLLSTDGFYDRTVAELARSFAPGEEECARRIRVVSVGLASDHSFNAIDENFKSVWQTLVAGREVVCAHSGERFDPLPKPEAAIIDFFATEPTRIVRKLSGGSIKIYSWMGGSTYALFYLFGPEKLGGPGHVRIKIEEEAQRSGRSFKEVALDFLFTPRGKVVRLPGLPPMYDYELYPQEFPTRDDLAFTIFPRILETLESCDGIFLLTAEAIEPAAVAAVRRWYAETSRPAYVCGPLLPPSGAHAVENEKKQSKESTEIQEFLDTMLEGSGENSLLYISFGSTFWPYMAPEKLWALVDVVMERNIPFILSHAPPMAIVPDEVRLKVKAYGKGILSPWSPQQTILEHRATGWFLAHGGHNGVTESICAGVPFILWPFHADQPTNVVNVAEVLQVGYELLEVRTGHGLHPILRNGRKPVGTIDALQAEAREVLAKAYGADGAEKRRRLQVLRNAVSSEWEKDGSATRDVAAFLESL